jgi:hypothetical protein
VQLFSLLQIVIDNKYQLFGLALLTFAGFTVVDALMWMYVILWVLCAALKRFLFQGTRSAERAPLPCDRFKAAFRQAVPWSEPNVDGNLHGELAKTRSACVQRIARATKILGIGLLDVGGRPTRYEPCRDPVEHNHVVLINEPGQLANIDTSVWRWCRPSKSLVRGRGHSGLPMMVDCDWYHSLEDLGHWADFGGLVLVTKDWLTVPVDGESEWACVDTFRKRVWSQAAGGACYKHGFHWWFPEGHFVANGRSYQYKCLQQFGNGYRVVYVWPSDGEHSVGCPLFTGYTTCRRILQNDYILDHRTHKVYGFNGTKPVEVCSEYQWMKFYRLRAQGAELEPALNVAMGGQVTEDATLALQTLQLQNGHELYLTWYYALWLEWSRCVEWFCRCASRIGDVWPVHGVAEVEDPADGMGARLIQDLPGREEARPRVAPAAHEQRNNAARVRRGAGPRVRQGEPENARAPRRGARGNRGGGRGRSPVPPAPPAERLAGEGEGGNVAAEAVGDGAGAVAAEVQPGPPDVVPEGPPAG